MTAFNRPGTVVSSPKTQVVYLAPPDAQKCMTPDQFYCRATVLLEHADSVMRAKMKDYAGANFSDNFRRTAAAAGTTPGVVWTVFFDKHLGAIYRFVRDGKTDSEGIKDRIADAINYLLLLYGLIENGDVPCRPAPG